MTLNPSLTRINLEETKPIYIPALGIYACDDAHEMLVLGHNSRGTLPEVNICPICSRTSRLFMAWRIHGTRYMIWDLLNVLAAELKG